MCKVIYNATECTPQDMGYKVEKLDILNKHLTSLIEKKYIHGANYAFAKDGKVFVSGAVGRLSYEEGDNRPMQPDSFFGIASITKLFTSLAIMKLVEDGKLSLSQSVGAVLEEFNIHTYKDVTFFHLLTHTSGLCPDPQQFYNPYEVSSWDFIHGGDNVELFKDKSWIARGLYSARIAPLGTQYVYSSFMFSVLGEVITRVSGMDCHAYIMEKIINPLGMQETFFDLIKENCDRVMIPHCDAKNRIAKIKNGSDLTKEDDEPNIPRTGGGLFSTPTDLIKLGLMCQNNGRLNGERIIGRKTLEKIRTNHHQGVLDFAWGEKGCLRPHGIGFDMRRHDNELYSIGTYNHEGYGTSILIMDPVENFTVVFRTSFMDHWRPENLWNTEAIIWSGIR